MYLITEMGGMIYVFAYNGPRFIQVQTISLSPEGFHGTAEGGDVHASPDGRFLYASNRGEANEIIVFEINSKTGKLNYVERKSSVGKSPRNIAIDPSGNYLLVANQKSDDIYIFHIHQQTGKLTTTDSKIDVGNPCCLKFATAIS
jgi:6-phosphogluconolactonase